MRFLTYQFSDPGGREPNEDSAASFSGEKIQAWIAADGLGGHISGEVASAEAVRVFSKRLNEWNSLNRESIEDLFWEMNRAVEELAGPLTTAVCAFTDGKKLFYGNNGDSRFYYLRGRKILHRSHDHSLAYLAYKSDTISYEEIPHHPGQNRLYHCLGNETDFFVELYPVIDPEPGDAFLLCTDGFWELISDTEIERALNIAQTPEEWMDNMLDVIHSRLQPTSDNYTAVCVIIRED